MIQRRLSVAVVACAAALAFPAAASAQIIEVGGFGSEVKPSCPDSPCLAVSRTTGYQAKVGPNRGLMKIPQNGRIVAWTIALGNPGKKQIAFFDSKLGGTSSAQLTILRAGTKLRSRVVAQGEPQLLQPYFGTTAQFALERSIPVKKGYVIGLTVPTWAPALAVGLGRDTSWRASRGKGTCEDTGTQTAQAQVGRLAQYYCLYQTARLAYSATLVTDPKPAATPKPKKKPRQTTRRRTSRR